MADLLSDDPRVADLVNETEALRARVAELEALVYVPGLWRCAKCDFQLSQMNLHAGSGNVSPRNEPGGTCPNCHGPLWRVTERQSGNRLCDDLERVVLERNAAEGRLETALRCGWEACRVSVYEMAEATIDECTGKGGTELERQFHRGRAFEAKGFSKGFGAMDPALDDHLKKARDPMGSATAGDGLVGDGGKT